MTAPNNNFWNRFTATITPVIFVWVVFCLQVPRILAASEPIVEHYPNGSIHQQIEVDDHRQPHGWSREYSETGVLLAERHYTHGIRHGLSRLYYTTGELMTEWNYRDGRREGPSLGYYKNGRLKDKGVYRDDLLEGEVLKYYPGGALKARMHFKHGHLEGESTTYYENGQVQHVYRYFNGQVWTRQDYSPDGKLLRKQEFPQPPHMP